MKKNYKIDSFFFRLKSYLAYVFTSHSVYYSFLLITMILGLIIGISYASSTGVDISYLNFRDEKFINFLQGDTALFTLLFFKFLNYLFLLFVFFLISTLRHFRFIGMLVFGYLFYILGVDIIVFFLSFSVGGLLFLIFGIVLADLIFIFLLSHYFLCCNGYCDIHFFRYIKNTPCNLNRHYFLILLINLLLLLTYYAIILSLFSPTIIIIIE